MVGTLVVIALVLLAVVSFIGGLRRSKAKLGGLARCPHCGARMRKNRRGGKLVYATVCSKCGRARSAV